MVRIACVGIVGKGNEPLYMRIFGHGNDRLRTATTTTVNNNTNATDRDKSNNSSSGHIATAAAGTLPASEPTAKTPHIQQREEIEFHFHIHSALDVVEEKLAARKPGHANDLYLGLLYFIEHYKVYGYVTNTKVKLIVLVPHAAPDAYVKGFLRDLHHLYVNAMSDPFTKSHVPITSRPFNDAVAQCVTVYENKGR